MGTSVISLHEFYYLSTGKLCRTKPLDYFNIQNTFVGISFICYILIYPVWVYLLYLLNIYISIHKWGNTYCPTIKFPLILFFFSFQDFGFHNKTVIRILIARSEIDLMNIRQRYKERYGKSLFHDIKVSFYKLLHIFSTAAVTQTVPLCLTIWFKTKQPNQARCKNNSTV